MSWNITFLGTQVMQHELVVFARKCNTLCIADAASLIFHLYQKLRHSRPRLRPFNSGAFFQDGTEIAKSKQHLLMVGKVIRHSGRRASIIKHHWWLAA